MLKFKFLSGDMNWQQYGGMFVSKKLNNGEFDYWLVMEVINLKDAMGDEAEYTYCVEIKAISPSQVSKADMDSAFGSMSFSDEQIEKYQNNELIQVETLAGYGIFAMLWSKKGNNLGKLMREARREARLINGLFGFYMDRPENRLGQDGWGMIRGQSVREFLHIE